MVIFVDKEILATAVDVMGADAVSKSSFIMAICGL